MHKVNKNISFTRIRIKLHASTEVSLEFYKWNIKKLLKKDKSILVQICVNVLLSILLFLCFITFITWKIDISGSCGHLAFYLVSKTRNIIRSWILLLLNGIINNQTFDDGF